MRLEPVLSEAACLVLRNQSDRTEVLTALARAAANVLERPDHMDILAGLEARETKGSTTTPEGVAFPHTVLPGLARTTLVIAALNPAVRFRPVDAEPVRLALCMVGPEGRPFAHLQLLASLARIVRSPEARDRLAGASDSRALFASLVQEDRSHA